MIRISVICWIYDTYRASYSITRWDSLMVSSPADGMVSPVNLPSGIINHTTLAIMLHQAGEYKQAEEQFLIGESYANSFLNQNGELDGEVMLLILESQVTRKTVFISATRSARETFPRCQVLSEYGKNA